MAGVFLLLFFVYKYDDLLLYLGFFLRTYLLNPQEKLKCVSSLSSMSFSTLIELPPPVGPPNIVLICVSHAISWFQSTLLQMLLFFIDHWVRPHQVFMCVPCLLQIL